MKKILILDGNPEDDGQDFSRYLEELKQRMASAQHQVQILALRDLEIKYCTGCWSCWWGPTPGECVFKDDSHRICRDYINSDVVIFASPLIMGFTSALLKKAEDKLIPLLHPYIELVSGECHHHKRYDHYPALGLIMGPEPGTDQVDQEITADMFSRFALNFKTELLFARMAESGSIQEVINEIDSI